MFSNMSSEAHSKLSGPILDDPTGDGWLTRERVLTSLLAFITLLMFYLCYQIVSPFLTPLAFSIAIAVSTQRPYAALARSGRHRSLVAAVAVLLVAVLLIVPAGLVVTDALNEGVSMFREINGDGPVHVKTSIEAKPLIGKAYRWAQRELKIDDQLRSGAGTIVNRASAVLTGSIEVVMQLFIGLFVLFFLYRDGDVALATLRRLLPLSDEEATQLLSRMNESILATVNGSFIASVAQAFLAGTIYLILDVPGAVLWAVATFFTGLIPMFGTALVWLPISIYLALTGHPASALILLGFGIVIIATIDNIVYPYLVGSRIRMHTVPTFFAVLGGVIAFGAAGLILGPAILSGTTGILDVWWKRTKSGRSAEFEVVEKEGSNLQAPAAFLETKSPPAVFDPSADQNLRPSSDFRRSA